MPQEIERRFLLKNSIDWRDSVTEKQKITQIYLGYSPVTRLRFYGMYDDPDARAVFTVKGKRTSTTSIECTCATRAPGPTN